MSKLARALETFRHVIRRAPPSDSPEEYVCLAYRVLLRREIDPAGLKTWREYITSGRFDQQYVIDAILNSIEYQVRFAVPLLEIIHRSRQAWIKTVPSFERVLDIGGSSPNWPEGALIELGYPHRPRRIDILDRPPDQQYWGKPKYDQSAPNRFEWGEVSYFHGSGEHVADIAALQDRSYDCVFLGQAIEHIYPDALPGMLEWARRHLAPAGRLVFDTPNRRLTRIQCPDSLIDPDHKHEYEPAEMAAVVTQAGFTVTKRVGMIHLPRQAASGEYDPREFVDAPLLSDDVDACYLFAFETAPA
jgi:SAM-dependent methyltransferase